MHIYRKINFLLRTEQGDIPFNVTFHNDGMLTTNDKTTEVIPQSNKAFIDTLYSYEYDDSKQIILTNGIEKNAEGKYITTEL